MSTDSINRYLSLLPLQLLCHMPKSQHDQTQHRTLDETKAISLVALTLSEEVGHNYVLILGEVLIISCTYCIGQMQRSDHNDRKWTASF